MNVLTILDLKLPGSFSKRNIFSENRNSMQLSSFRNEGRVVLNNSDCIITKIEVPTVKLSEEQQKVMEIAISGKSMFFTGAAGTGKSFLLQQMIQELRRIHPYDSVFVTASTGIAACNIGGCTLHSFAGVGVGEGAQEDLVQIVLKNKNSKRRWKYAKVLIVDEISMLSGDFFDKLEYIARVVRKNENPFGGMQIVLCGDFLQLPPVEKGIKSFCFQAKCWQRVVSCSVELKKVFRQNEQSFVTVLNELRVGKISTKSLEVLSRCKSNDLSNSKDGIRPTILYPLKADVESENIQQLNLLRGDSIVFKAEDSSKFPNSSFLSQLQKSCAAPQELKLKLNAQVILLRNLNFDKGCVNGARGVIVGFEEEGKHAGFPIVKFSSGHTLTIGPEEWNIELGGSIMATRKQVPLNLAWALSVHKSQGMTIEKLVVSLEKSFEYGMAYVALSRATSLQGLQLLDFDPRVIRAHPKVLEFYSTLQNISW